MKCTTKKRLLLQIKCLTDKQMLLFELINELTKFIFVCIYERLKRRPNSKNQFRHDKQRKLKLIPSGKKE